MTAPLQRGVEPGESEFSHGKGMVPPQSRGYVPTNRVMLNAFYQTDSSNPNATVEGTLVANPTQTHLDPVTGVPVMGDLEESATPRVRESGPSSMVGQFAKLDVSKYNPGHYADGLQDGSGEEWRRNQPPNPVQ